MKENQVLAFALALAMGAAYWSWTKEEEKVTEEKAVIVQTEPAQLTELRFITRTQTVSVSRRDVEGDTYVWFDIQTKTRTRGFVGNEKVDKMFESFAPFVALRSLGSVGGAALENTKLDHPQKRLVLGLKSGDKSFDVGGRTHGSRDHYVRPSGSKEVFLVASKQLGDLEYPESSYMQRKLRRIELKEVAAVELYAGGKSKRLLHQNRLSDKDAFWATEAASEQASETVDNYIHKLDTLTARSYLTDKDALAKATEVLRVVFKGEDDKAVEELTLFRAAGEGDKTEYRVRSTATHMPVEVTKSVAEQLEGDLAVVFSEP